MVDHRMTNVVRRSGIAGFRIAQTDNHLLVGIDAALAWWCDAGRRASSNSVVHEYG